jgi:uncharacterized phage-associated protein
MANVQDVAKYFLTLSEPDEGDFVSNLKLQKLIYYAQGFHLAIHGQPLFPDPIQAWAHGPVVPNLYHHYKDHGSNGIPVPVEFNVDTLDAGVRELLNEVWNVYGQFSAWKLRNMTHDEPPWKNTERGEVISESVMRDYFRTQLKS